MIKLENVTYRYNESSPPALLNVSVEIKDGESVCVMGANGSGKSTFAKLIAGLIKNQQGRMLIFPQINSAMPVGLLFQNPDNQLVAVTVEKEIAFGLENQGIIQEEMKVRIKNVLKRLSITHLSNRLTSSLSVGEKQRVALASVLVCEPSILVLDEPDSFLDKEGKQLFRQLLQSVREHHKDLTVIEITQYPHIAKTYDRLIVFDKGRILEGTSAQTSAITQAGLQPDERQIAIPHVWNNGDKSESQISRINCERISFTYPGSDKAVVRHFSSEFKTNEITFIIGPSGSGKSTLGMLLCRIVQPELGDIDYFDAEGRKIEFSKSRGRISAALQQPERQFFLNNCQQEIEFGAANFKRYLSSKTIRAFFEMVGLQFESFNSRDPFTLSLGEKRRLAFGCVLSITPNFVVFDEPTCALDQEGTNRFFQLAKALKKSGMGLVIISHDEDVVKALADKVIALDGKGNYWSLPIEKYLSRLSEESSLSSNF